MKIEYYKIECESCYKVSTVKAEDVTIGYDLRKQKYILTIRCPKCREVDDYEIKHK